MLAALAELDPYPDAHAAFARLADAGVRVATLTNGGAQHTRRLLERAGLADRVEVMIAVDEVEAYKPGAAPYRRAAERLRVEPGELTLVAAHGSDVLGTRAAGLQAIWIDRLESRWPFPLAEPRSAPGLVEAVEVALAP